MSVEETTWLPPRIAPPPGYEWIIPWVASLDALYGETVARLLNDPRMKKALQKLQSARLHEGIDQQTAIRNLLYAASMPHEFFG